MPYLAVKHLHVTCVVLSFTLFVLRGLWMISGAPMLQRKWVKVLPHVIDTLLLAAGITAAVMIRQYPFVAEWLTAKVFGLIAYIILGTLALKRGKTRSRRIGYWLAALATFGYIVAVAFAKNPNPLVLLG
ncbi:MAG TPA: SirB2 family protein [Burkholderiales bacterium]|nr:SirB2 family protein [Burkholderiales bacterium]